MRIYLLAVVAFVFVVIQGCAHPIVITPDIAKIDAEHGTQKIEKNVGYYIAPELHALEVTTPGGGGDKVKYHPYADMETAFYKMLVNVFKGVTVLKIPDDSALMQKNSINFVITPVLQTDSSSSSAFTWPPTQFTVNMTCNVNDTNGNQVVSLTVKGEGAAEYDEFKSDFSLSGKRALEDALLKMQKELLQAKALRQ